MADNLSHRRMTHSEKEKKSKQIAHEIKVLLTAILDPVDRYISDNIGHLDHMELERNVAVLKELVSSLAHNEDENPFAIYPDTEPKPDAPDILLAVRDINIRYSLENHLARSYNIHVVTEVSDALDILEREVISLIVYDSDITRENDLELCNFVKTHTTYSHIPVVLIFGKKKMHNRIEAMELRADAYVEKPFSTDYVNAIVQNLLEMKERLRQRYITTPWLDPSIIAITDADREFMKRIQKIISDNIDNSLFGVDQLAEHIHMSRSSLYRKIKGITNYSTNSFIQMERLRKAALLLMDGGVRVNEVCYMVGFNSSSFFTKCFKKQFGILPKDYK